MKIFQRNKTITIISIYNDSFFFSFFLFIRDKWLPTEACNEHEIAGILTMNSWNSRQKQNQEALEILPSSILNPWLVFSKVFLGGGDAPAAYESSQARGWIGVKATNLHHIHSIARSQPHDPHQSLQQYQILNPLSKARAQTHILMDTSQVLNLLSHNGNSLCVFFIFVLFYLFI